MAFSGKIIDGGNSMDLLITKSEEDVVDTDRSEYYQDMEGLVLFPDLENEAVTDTLSESFNFEVDQSWQNEAWMFKPLSVRRREKYSRMFDLILKSPQGPHLSRKPSSGINIALSVIRHGEDPKQNEKILPLPQKHRGQYQTWMMHRVPSPDSVSANLHNSFLKLSAKKILNKKTTIWNRQKLVRCGSSTWRQTTWGDDGWGDEAVNSAEESLKELGVELKHRSLTWLEQLRLECRKHGDSTCYTPSLLRWSWTMTGNP